MSSINVNQIKKELKKWTILSNKFRMSSVVIEAKLKSHMVVFESKADEEQINQLQTEIGNFQNSWIQVKKYLEDSLSKITKNVNNSIECCLNDADGLEARDVFTTPKKRRSPPSENKAPLKKKVRRQLFPKESEKFFDKESKEIDEGKSKIFLNNSWFILNCI